MFTLVSCQSPLEGDAQRQLNEAVNASIQRELNAMPDADPQITLSPDNILGEELSSRKAELDALGPQVSSAGAGLDVGASLDGGDMPVASISLESAIQSAVENNLGVQQTRINQGISAAEVVRAEAAFDAVFGAGVDFARINENNPDLVIGGGGIVPPDVFVQDQDLRQWGFTTDLSTRTTSGGQIGIGFGSQNQAIFNSSSLDPNPAWNTDVTLGVGQPLLRGFGEDVNTAEIQLARNADRRSAVEIRSELLDLLVNVESAYWNLVFARQRLVVSDWLVAEGERIRVILDSRRGFDTTMAQYADAVATVESRKTLVIEARRDIGKASDQLKVLLNDPAMPVGGEIDLIPVDFMVDSAITYSLRDSVMTALERSPLLDLATLSIDDASIAEIVARNGRLPQLDLAAEVSWLGLASSVGTSMNEVNGEFVDYLLGLQFSQAVGNRAAESVFRQARLQRSSAVIAYQQAVQKVLFDVKNSIRDIRAEFALIGQARSFRLAQAENLRALEALQQTLAALTPEFLSLLFQRQDRLAQAQLQELEAMVSYNVAVADLERAMGTGLQANKIDLIVVDPEASGETDSQ